MKFTARTISWLIALTVCLSLVPFAVHRSLAADANPATDPAAAIIGADGLPDAAPGRMQFARAVARLNLSAAQTTAIADILKVQRTANRATVDELVSAREAMFDAIHAETGDEAAIRAAHARVSAAELTLALARAETIKQVRAVLTPEQRTTAVALRDEAKTRAKDHVGLIRGLIGMWIDRHAST